MTYYDSSARGAVVSGRSRRDAIPINCPRMALPQGQDGGAQPARLMGVDEMLTIRGGPRASRRQKPAQDDHALRSQPGATVLSAWAL
jgi:hypothetical protein